MAERKRCAIYTRKSTEEGLEQAFNSLDAQREACAAYILSQAHEGWEPVRELYDDGGWSGGNMDRPALQQLLQDVEAGRVDVIVVYKVDRLSRSLADFARIIDIMDKAGASFVSVTQAFNTTNSMGRLTLNVLLSFAQFEREVTGERIRDKIATSKKKGMWMGGPVPLGYRLADRRLLIEPAEAETVRIIFERYVALRSIRALVDELRERGLRTKVRQTRSGPIGGTHFGRGPLAVMLRNPTYLGKVRHREELYEGEHDAIIDEALWNDAQRVMLENGSERKLGSKLKAPSLLTGMLTDPDGNEMTPSHACKGSKRYRYYITREASGDTFSKSWRVPAGDLDKLVVKALASLLRKRGEQAVATDAGDLDALELARDLAAALPSMPVPEQRQVALDVGLAVRLSANSITVATSKGAALEATLDALLTRRGYELRLALPPEDVESSRGPDPVLLKLVAHANAAQQMALSGEPHPAVVQYGRRHLERLVRISWLAPDILTAIVEGRQPVELTARRLMRASTIPLDWRGQRAMFGLG
jgi:site-specific DNA recombinase